MRFSPQQCRINSIITGLRTSANSCSSSLRRQIGLISQWIGLQCLHFGLKVLITLARRISFFCISSNRQLREAVQLGNLNKQFRFKKSIEVHFIRSKISLLYFYDVMTSICENKNSPRARQTNSYRTNVLIEFHHFMEKEQTQLKTKQLKLFYYFIQYTSTSQSWRARVESKYDIFVFCDSYKTYLHIKGPGRNAKIMETQEI